MQPFADSSIGTGPAILIAYLLPFAALYLWKRKTSARMLPLILGLFAYMSIILPRGIMRMGFADLEHMNVWLYYLFRGVLSAVFEEIIRYLVFRFPLQNYGEYTDAVSYGIGHGACEIMLSHSVSGITAIDSMLITYDLINGVAFSIAMSVIVFTGVQYTESKKLLWTAIGLHTFMDFTKSFYFSGMMPIGMYMLLNPMLAAVMCFIAYRIYKSYEY